MSNIDERRTALGPRKPTEQDMDSFDVLARKLGLASRADLLNCESRLDGSVLMIRVSPDSEWVDAGIRLEKDEPA